MFRYTTGSTITKLNKTIYVEVFFVLWDFKSTQTVLQSSFTFIIVLFHTVILIYKSLLVKYCFLVNMAVCMLFTMCVCVCIVIYLWWKHECVKARHDLYIGWHICQLGLVLIYLHIDMFVFEMRALHIKQNEIFIYLLILYDWGGVDMSVIILTLTL